MPFDGSGNFSRAYNWVNDKVAGIKIIATRMDGEFDNYANGMNQTMLRTGVVPMGGPLNMGGNTINSLGSGTAAVPAIRFSADPSTGIYMPAIGQIAITSAGTPILGVAGSGINVVGSLTANSALITGTLTVSGLVTLNNLAVNGDVIASSFHIDSQFGLYNQAGPVPTIALDAGDFMAFNRASNILTTYINSGQQLTISPVGVTVPNALMVGDGNNLLSGGGGSPYWQFDANDYMQYDRAGNGLNFNLGGTTRATIATTFFNINVPLSVIGTATVSDKIIVGSAALPGKINLVANNVNAGYVEFIRPTDGVRHGYIGFPFPPNGSIAYMNDQGGGHLFGGGSIIQQTGNFFVQGGDAYISGRVRPGGEANFYLDLNAGAPLIGFDPADYVFYDRSGNSLNTIIGGQTAMTVGAAGPAIPQGGAGGPLVQTGYRNHEELSFGSSATLGVQHVDRLLYYNGPGGNVITLGAGVPSGAEIYFINNGSGIITFTAGGGTTLYATIGGSYVGGNRFMNIGLTKYTITSFASGTAWLISQPWPGGGLS